LQPRSSGSRSLREKRTLQKKTKIVCTVGPASLEVETLEQLVQAGMNCARINTAYGDFDRYSRIVENVRKVAEIPVILDLKGPEVRVRASKELRVEKGEVIDVGADAPVRFNHEFLGQMSLGDVILIDNGRIKTKVTEKTQDQLRLLVEAGGVIADGKGVNVPNKRLKVPTLSSRDLRLIEFAKSRDIEFIALSFTRNREDIVNLRRAAEGYKGAVIAKIENLDGIQNFEEILHSADVVMIARGDLGVEIPAERVPLVQKSLIRRCNQNGRTVITATEMLESMMNQSFPTRAEVSDVANAILDGTDATMLSGETAVGRYPVESTAMMTRIAMETEKATKSNIEEKGFINISDTVSRSIHNISKNMPLDRIVTLTRSGYTARMISRFKLKQPIIAVTPNRLVKRQLQLVYGVVPVHIDYSQDSDRILSVANKLHRLNLLKERNMQATSSKYTKSKNS